MSIVQTSDVFCDVKRCPQWAHGCSTTHGAADARRLAKRNGWTRRKVGDRWADLCPDHRDATTLDADTP